MSELSLTWDDHHNTLVGVFEKLLESNSLVDCTLAAEGQYIKAHKIILSACSPYFELLFKQETEKNPIVVLKDIKFKELKAMINFIYRGEVKVPEERLGDFVDAAESLQIKGLGGNGYESPKPVESELTIIKRGESSTSAHPRKRRRRSYVSDGEDDSRTTSVSETVHKDISSRVSVSLVQVDKNNSTQNNQCVSALRKSAEISLVSISTRSEEPLKTSESISLTKCILPDVTTTDNVPYLENVIKCEPETISEEFLPDLEIVETKKESFTEESLSQELVIDSEDNTSETNARFDDSEICSNQFPSFSTTLHPTSGAENLFVPSVVPEANRVQGPSALDSTMGSALLRCRRMVAEDNRFFKQPVDFKPRGRSGVPNQQAGIPMDQPVASSRQTGISKEETLASSQQTGNRVIYDYPSRQTGILLGKVSSNLQTGIPMDKVSSNLQTGIPMEKVTSSLQTGIPMGKVSSSRQTGIPMGKVSSSRQTGIPMGKVSSSRQTGIPIVDVSSIRQTGIPMDKVSSNLQTGIPMDKVSSNLQTGIPMDKVSSNLQTGIPMDKVSSSRQTGIPMEKVTSSLQTGIPMDKVSSNLQTGIPMEKVTSSLQTGIPMGKVSSTRQTGIPMDKVSSTGIPTGQELASRQQTGIPNGQSPSRRTRLSTVKVLVPFKHTSSFKTTPVQEPSTSEPFLCEKCGKVFQTPSKLFWHNIHFHKTEQPCKFCGKVFRLPYKLRSHLRMHGVEWPHESEICSKSYPSVSDLVKHMSEHSGERRSRSRVPRRHDSQPRTQAPH